MGAAKLRAKTLRFSRLNIPPLARGHFRYVDPKGKRGSAKLNRPPESREHIGQLFPPFTAGEAAEAARGSVKQLI